MSNCDYFLKKVSGESTLDSMEILDLEELEKVFGGDGNSSNESHCQQTYVPTE